jgi:hypothetical protein
LIFELRTGTSGIAGDGAVALAGQPFKSFLVADLEAETGGVVEARR